MHILTFTLQDVQDDVRRLSGRFKLDFFLTQESYRDGLFLQRVQLVLFWLNGEDVSSQLLLSGEIVLDWILSLVLDGDGVFFWFSDSHGPKVKNLAVVLSYGNDWRNLEGFSLDFDHFNILFDVEALRVFNLKLDLRLEFVLLFCLEDDFDDLLLAWLQSSAGVGNFEFLAQCINS